MRTNIIALSAAAALGLAAAAFPVESRAQFYPGGWGWSYPNVSGYYNYGPSLTGPYDYPGSYPFSDYYYPGPPLTGDNF